MELKPHRSYDYKYIVDGNRLNDPNNRDMNPDVAGGTNSVLYIGSNRHILPEGDLSIISSLLKDEESN